MARDIGNGQSHAGEQHKLKPFDSRELRDALGQFATGVAVVTILPGTGVPLGITVNSFASVSLDPPLILWSLQKDSEALEAFDCTETFVVNVLAGNAKSLSDRYARRDNHQLDAGHFCLSETGLPLLNNAKVSFECATLQRIEGGDHIIYLAGVTALSAVDQSEPLVFYAGAYRQLDMTRSSL